MSVARAGSMSSMNNRKFGPKGWIYGPTKRWEMVGPIDESPLDDCALEPEAAAKLWTLSEQKTSLSWSP